MAFIKKEWKNRLVEFAGRRKLTRVAGSIDNQIVVDVTREEGTVSQQGDAFSKENMNDLEQRIEDGFNDAIDKDNILNKEEVEANTEAGIHVADALVVKDLIDSLKFPNGTQFYADMQDGKPGFNTDPERGADTFVPFSGDSTVILKVYIKSEDNGKNSIKVNIANYYPNYKNITSDNIFFDPKGSLVIKSTSNVIINFNVKYDQNNGDVTIAMDNAVFNSYRTFILIITENEGTDYV